MNYPTILGDDPPHNSQTTDFRKCVRSKKAPEKNFRDSLSKNTPTLKCLFGDLEAPATFISPSTIKCQSPKYHTPGFVDLKLSLKDNMWSSAIPYLYYEAPVPQPFLPRCFIDSFFLFVRSGCSASGRLCPKCSSARDSRPSDPLRSCPRPICSRRLRFCGRSSHAFRYLRGHRFRLFLHRQDLWSCLREFPRRHGDSLGFVWSRVAMRPWLGGRFYHSFHSLAA